MKRGSVLKYEVVNTVVHGLHAFSFLNLTFLPLIIVIWRVLLINDMWFVFFLKSDWKIIYEVILDTQAYFYI